MHWPVIVALVIGIPIILFVPALIWIAVASGLSAVTRDTFRAEYWRGGAKQCG